MPSPLPSFPNAPFHFLFLFLCSTRSCRSTINSFAARVPCREVRGFFNRKPCAFSTSIRGLKLDSARIDFEESFDARQTDVFLLVQEINTLHSQSLHLCWIKRITVFFWFFISLFHPKIEKLVQGLRKTKKITVRKDRARLARRSPIKFPFQLC